MNKSTLRLNQNDALSFVNDAVSIYAILITYVRSVIKVKNFKLK